ncbi:phage major capsid protein [Sphingobium sp. 3R8]|uniref:phage major capsid protein n=1 Tax=Sphingobium sp. 3R8 TaxID=2874921 RepID=UPI001CCBE3F4|nr:phage major capsid protein [Sphingobium sp. 3R8]MBZ9650329.1 phage major capsid protein [Sphingobium sp. 3R8]
MAPLTLPVPRALQTNSGKLPRLRASQDVLGTIQQVTAAFDEFKATHNRRYSDIENAINEISTTHASLRLGGGSGNFTAEDPTYSAQFSAYFRNGAGEDEIRAAQQAGGHSQIHASMSSGSNENGGYLAPTEWDRRIQQAQLATSPMRRLAQVRTTTVGAYSTVWNSDQWGSGWVGETAARPATSTPTLSPITFAAGEIYAMPAITQRLLDDAQFGVEQWLATSVEREFNKQEGIAYISGNGVNKPYGLLQYVPGGAAETQHPGGTLGITISGHASTIPNTDALVTFAYQLTAPYRQNATWLMNSATAATIAKMKDGQGNYIWRESLIVGQPSTLLGRPVEIDENMPNIEAGAFPIAFGDFQSGYLINDRTGVRILRDPYTNKPYVMFYSTKRVSSLCWVRQNRLAAAVQSVSLSSFGQEPACPLQLLYCWLWTILQHTCC